MPSTIGPLRVGDYAPGGHCVGRTSDGRVIFVRGALPGELVDVRVTDASKERFWRGEVTRVIEASDDRVEAPCPVAGSCGGCDYQHVRPAAQRAAKGRLVAEQLSRIAGLQREVEVEAAPVARSLGWRSRMRYQLSDGSPALRAHRSNELVPVPAGGCPIADPAGADPDWVASAAEGADEVLVATASSGAVVRPVGSKPVLVRQDVAGRSFEVRHDGFWQSHVAAPEVLVDAVLQVVLPVSGESGFDLYCGVGLFARFLADAGVEVTGVEGNRAAIESARRNVPSARFVVGRVEQALRRLPNRTDVVVLDPPRTGAGKVVVEQIVRREPRVIAYVSCDPATLARDLRVFAELGYEVESLRVFDLFPMTHHVECVTGLRPA